MGFQDEKVVAAGAQGPHSLLGVQIIFGPVGVQRKGLLDLLVRFSSTVARGAT